jgi:hypothetical protein
MCRCIVSNVRRIADEQEPNTERALLAQPSRNDPQAHTSKFTKKGEKNDFEILALKQENVSLTNQNEQLKPKIIKLHSKLNSRRLKDLQVMLSKPKVPARRENLSNVRFFRPRT